jgi:hypothetical protein
MSRIYRKLKKLTLQRIHNPLTKWVNELSRQFPKEVQMAVKSMNKCSVPLTIKKMKIKLTLRFHLTPTGMTIINNTNNKC